MDSIKTLFIIGGKVDMTILTILLVAVIIAAWKAPGWVKDLGVLALITGISSFFLGFYPALDLIQQVGDISGSVLLGGLWVSLITPIYGILIYILSLLIRIGYKIFKW
jgi:hypothetical protein